MHSVRKLAAVFVSTSLVLLVAPQASAWTETVTVEYDWDDAAKCVTKITVPPEPVVFNAAFHRLRNGRSIVEWKLKHPSPAATGVKWSIVAQTKNYDICPDRIEKGGEWTCSAENKGIEDSDWSYTITAEDRDDPSRCPPALVDPAIVFRSGKGTILGLLVAFGLLVGGFYLLLRRRRVPA